MISKEFIELFYNLKKIRAKKRWAKIVKSREIRILNTGPDSKWMANNIDTSYFRKGDGEIWTHYTGKNVYNPNGPSMVKLDSDFKIITIEWSNDLGKLHHDEHPAQISFIQPVTIEELSKMLESGFFNESFMVDLDTDRFKNIHSFGFYQNGKLHCEDGAASFCSETRYYGLFGNEIDSVQFFLNGSTIDSGKFKRDILKKDIESKLKLL